MTIKMNIAAGIAAGFLLTATTAAASITYAGSVTPVPVFGVGNMLVVDYTFTTNGTIGSLSGADITGWTLQFNYNGNIQNLSGTGIDLVYGPNTGLFATPTDLNFDFTDTGARGFQVGSAVIGSLDFSTSGNEIISPPGTTLIPQITTFYFNPSLGAVFGGYNTKTGVEVIGTATAGGVPEPSSWAMLIAGFGLTGAAMRRKARRITA